MAHHVFTCDGCGRDFGVDVPGLAIPPKSPPCSCGSRETWKNYSKNAVHFSVENGTPKGLISTEQTAKGIAKFWGRDRDEAVRHVNERAQDQRRQRHIKGLSRTEGPYLRHVGSVPVDDYHAKVMETDNKQFFQDEIEAKGPKKALGQFYVGGE